MTHKHRIISPHTTKVTANRAKRRLEKLQQNAIDGGQDGGNEADAELLEAMGVDPFEKVTVKKEDHRRFKWAVVRV